MCGLTHRERERQKKSDRSQRRGAGEEKRPCRGSTNGGAKRNARGGRWSAATGALPASRKLAMRDSHRTSERASERTNDRVRACISERGGIRDRAAGSFASNSLPLTSYLPISPFECPLPDPRERKSPLGRLLFPSPPSLPFFSPSVPALGFLSSS